MLNSNEIVDFQESETSNEEKKSKSADIQAEANGSMGVPWFSKFSAALKASANIGSENNSVQRMKRNVQIVQSNSVLLEGILNLVIPINKELGELDEGSLVKIDEVELTILNEQDVRAANMIQPGVLKDIDGLEVEGMSLDAGMLMTSMLNDYFYVLSGKHNNGDDILLKIPLRDQFQSSYSINDILIGKVSVVGLYKGKISENKLANTLNFFSANSNKEPQISMITESNYTESELQEKNEPLTAENNKTFHFIDSIAVLQNVSVKGGN